jgi:HSP20 family protein
MAQYWLSNPWLGDPWPGLGDLRRRMDELFERAGGTSALESRAGVFPPVNLYETGDSYVLTAELPGLRGEEIEITVERDRLTLRGERRIETPQDASLHRLERRGGAFRRALQLPVAVDGDKVQAIYRNGVLTLRLPKAPEHQPRRVEVKGN